VSKQSIILDLFTINCAMSKPFRMINEQHYTQETVTINPVVILNADCSGQACDHNLVYQLK